MTALVTALTGTDGISANNLWSSVTEFAPIIVIAVLFAFGFTIGKKVIKGISKGKVKM